MPMKVKKEFYKIIRTILAVGFGILIITPLLFMVSTSFKTDSQIWKYDIQWIPKPIILDNYKRVFTDMPFGKFFTNSVIVAGGVTLGQIVTGYLAAYAFARIRFAGRDKIFMIFLATMMIPSYVLIIPQYIMVDKLGMMNSYGAMILPAVVSAFSIFLLRNFMYSIPFELDEAAMIDGCNRLQILLRIIVPLTKPALSAMVIFVFMNAWNNFLWPLLVTSSESMRTIPLALSYFQTSNDAEYGPLMAAALVASLPILIVFMVAQNKFIEGMTMSGVKG
ncbi:MAG: carbohydrate ABC transporter permease [Lachnospiraceae bacterium]|jgi:multiple sugar transport system permease protein|nr:carbohydrate ABC transporter permease [Lachnospiraceae bacterium]